MSFDEVIETIAQEKEYDESVGSFAWRTVENWLNVNGYTCDNDEQQRGLVSDAVWEARMFPGPR